jgi:uncharacterized protein
VTIERAPTVEECRTGADADRRDDCRVVGFVGSIQAFWKDEFAHRSASYAPARKVIFSGAVQAGCGFANSAQGPFYCPEDGKVYLDISFFNDLQTRFGAQGGPFAMGDVIAHEYGHHVQNQQESRARINSDRVPRGGLARDAGTHRASRHGTIV